MSTSTRRSATSRSSVLLVAGVLLVAANLRPALTSVGPVLPALRADLGLGATTAGALTALPLVAFAAVALVTPAAARRLGPERTLVLGLVLLLVGTAARSAGGPVVLFAATGVLAVGIGTANVLLPVLVRSALPERVGLVTSWYAATLTLMAAAASGLAVPIATAAAGGWRTALGCWAVLALAAALVWAPAALRRGPVPGRPVPAGTGPPDAPGAPSTEAADPGRRVGGPWRSATAWAVAAYFAVQSAIFYSVVAWLPTVLVDRGAGATGAGLHLLVYQLTGLLSGLALPLALRGRADQRAVAAVSSGFALVGCTGLALSGAGAWTWVWTVVGGVGSGATFTLALTLIALRAADAAGSAALSAMAQSSGYLVAAAGPVVVGVLHETTGGWSLPLLVLALAAGVGALTGQRAGVARTVGAADGPGRVRGD